MKCDTSSRVLSWQEKAACYGLYHTTGEDLFFPRDNPGGPREGKGISGETERVTKAKLMCVTCPVVKKCLAHAIRNEETGIWGGTTETERKKLTKKAILSRGWMIWNATTLSTIPTLTTRRHAAPGGTAGSTGVCALNHVTACISVALSVTVR